MADLAFGSGEWLKSVRALGVKKAAYHPDGKLAEVEFFPRSLIDLPGLDEAVDPMESPTDRPPPAAPEDGQPNLPPAMQRVLSRKSVS